MTVGEEKAEWASVSEAHVRHAEGCQAFGMAIREGPAYHSTESVRAFRVGPEERLPQFVRCNRVYGWPDPRVRWPVFGQSFPGWSTEHTSNGVSLCPFRHVS